MTRTKPSRRSKRRTFTFRWTDGIPWPSDPQIDSEIRGELEAIFDRRQWGPH